MPGTKTRLDALLVSRGFYIDTASATRAILAGKVTSPEKSNLKPGLLVAADIELKVIPSRSYVSRGGEKLAAALSSFALDVNGLKCLDIGAGSGGFSDCLLQQGAATVLAIDVGYGQFDWLLRQDPRVTLLERTNFRTLQPSDLAGLIAGQEPQNLELFDLAVVDLSFIRSSHLLHHIKGFLKPAGQMIILIKPQFELPAELDGKPGFQHGVVSDPALHQQVLEAFLLSASEAGLVTNGLMPSPLKGPDGNREFLFWATLSGLPATIDVCQVIQQT